jgi:citrate lyase subunit beta/citryl-CoA lyase
MRSLLFVPADSDRKRTRALQAGADALILDLEDSVAADAKEAARRAAAAFLADRANRRSPVFVRINALTSGLAADDLDAVVPAAPDGILLPKSEGGQDVMLLSAMLAAREALAGIDDGATRILVIATETASALFSMGSYRGASARLGGISWGSEDLSAALGSETNRDADGRLTDPYRLARALCIAGAAAAGVAALDAPYPEFRDLDGLAREAEAGRRDGFSGKLAIHPDQVAVINRVFTPTPEAVAHARAIVDAFAAAGNPGVVGLDGRMLDRPHLIGAERVLARARAAGLI